MCSCLQTNTHLPVFLTVRRLSDFNLHKNLFRSVKMKWFFPGNWEEINVVVVSLKFRTQRFMHDEFIITLRFIRPQKVEILKQQLNLYAQVMLVWRWSFSIFRCKFNETILTKSKLHSLISFGHIFAAKRCRKSSVALKEPAEFYCLM